LVLLVALLVPAASCHRKNQQKELSGVEALHTPAEPGQEEKWTEPEPEEMPKPPPAPPPPPEPTSPPPTEALGFELGQGKEAAMRRCSKLGTWGKRGASYTCSRALKGASIEAKPLLSFCGEKLCAAGAAITIEAPDFESWNARFTELKAALVALHGAPTVDVVTVPDSCKNDTFVKCLDDGTANLEATWTWKAGHRVSLTMSKKKTDDGPSAIRFVSVVGG
jgi:hypothetical protein